MTMLLKIRGLHIRRADKSILRVKSLDMCEGEVLAIVGPNGAGKTTLLLAVAGLLGPQQGQIVFRGEALNRRNRLEYRRRMSLAFQVPLLLDMSVAENVALGLRFRQVDPKQVAARVAHWLRRLGIESLAKRRAGELSGGEAQRVSLARAFVLEPELLLLDEPFPALDPPARTQLLKDMSALLRRDKRTAIVVTHQLEEAARLGDRVAVILGGRVRQIGAAAHIRAHPADRQVAAFLGLRSH